MFLSSFIYFIIAERSNKIGVYLLITTSILVIGNEVLLFVYLYREKNNPYKDLDRMLCPVCYKYTLIEWVDICHECGWQHNMVQYDNPNDDGGANNLSLNDYREFHKLKKSLNPNYTWKANAREVGNPSKEDLKELRKLVKTKD